MPKEKALALVDKAAGIDLIEISPTAKPPVARLMSFDKYRYMQGKADKKARLARKTAELKQVQISIRAARNDLMIKVKQLEKFLGEGHPVDVVMRLRGREKYDKPRALAKLDEFLRMVTTVEYKKLGEPRFGGRGVMVPIARK